VHCWISDEGLALLAGLDPIVNAADEAAVSVLSPAQLQQLIRLLEVIRDES
jgi:hypothetical protein